MNGRSKSILIAALFLTGACTGSEKSKGSGADGPGGAPAGQTEPTFQIDPQHSQTSYGWHTRFSDTLDPGYVLVNRATSNKPPMPVRFEGGKAKLSLRVYSQDEEVGVRVVHYVIVFQHAGKTLWTEKLIPPKTELRGRTQVIQVELRREEAPVLPGDYDLRVTASISVDRRLRTSDMGTLKLNLSEGS